MSRYQRMFEGLSERGEGAFVPFAMLGDPDEESSLAVLKAFVDGGADALELGLPFSDPIADGPTIQASATRCLERGMTPDRALAIVGRLREEDQTTPVGLLVYANLVLHKGVEGFYREVAELGVDSVLVADVPTREAGPFVEAARRYGVAPVLIAAPNSSEAQLAQIASLCEGYTYVVSRAGVTGAENRAGSGHQALIARLRELGAPPALLGFGISSPEQVLAALEAGAAGAICGSAIVKRVARMGDEGAASVLAEVRAFVAAMKGGTRRS